MSTFQTVLRSPAPRSASKAVHGQSRSTNGQRADEAETVGGDDAHSDEGSEGFRDAEADAQNDDDKANGDAREDSSVEGPAPPEDGVAVPALAGQTIKLMLVTENPNSASADSGKDKEKLHPQASLDKFWKNFDPEYLGKITRLLPAALTAKDLSTTSLTGEAGHSTVRSYEEARERCIRDVQRIVRECRDLNQKYTDTHFDIERDLKITMNRTCLDGIVVDDDDKAFPSDVKRVTDMFKTPKFFVDGTGYDDILQGSVGDCWYLAALSALSCNQKLIERVCVIQDQVVGVYGFVLHRDGEWHQCIIDDKLYLRAPSFDESSDIILERYNVNQKDQEHTYKELFQTGSKSLYFAQCRDADETWVPLLEKAFAKAHGDYSAIAGGQTGEAIEDMTGGVTTEMYTTNILDRDLFWRDELSRIGKDFVFSAAVARWRDWRSGTFNDNPEEREARKAGIVSRHAYAVLATYEGHGQRLVKIRNPWGKAEWTGAWADGSREWTADWIHRLDHTFGDDGIFWMSYMDFLDKYKYIDRTRLFGKNWHVAQAWTQVQVPWSIADYLDTRFSIDVPEDSRAVIVLSQLDDRYFRGLQGKYSFDLQFRIQRDGDDPDDYIARSRGNYELRRSVNVEVQLPKGIHTVLMKVIAYETGQDDVETVIRDNLWKKEKITQIGKLYDLAHRKGQLTSSDKDKNGEPTNQPSVLAPSENKDDPDRNPWNAVCVVGLKVYSKSTDLQVKVVPLKADEEKEPVLDRDDVAKAALTEVHAKSEEEENAKEDENVNNEDVEDKDEHGKQDKSSTDGEKDKGNDKWKEPKEGSLGREATRTDTARRKDVEKAHKRHEKQKSSE